LKADGEPSPPVEILIPILQLIGVLGLMVFLFS